MFYGIFPITYCKVIFFFNASHKCVFKYGFLILSPVISIVLIVLFIMRASARIIKLPSSDKSLLLAMSKNVMPSFKASSSANRSKPASEKLFLPMSICLSVLLYARNLDKIEIPSLLIIFPPRESSWSIVVSERYSTISFKPSSWILFWPKFKNLMLLFYFRLYAINLRP